MLKNFFKLSLIKMAAVASLLMFTPSLSQAADALSVGVVNFKSVVEKSKMGKQEQENFEAMKKQMESSVSDKEKKLNELAGKLNDADFLDSISADAETNMKREFRTLSQEMSQIQQQFYQTLQQAHMKILQKLSEAISKASEKVSKDKKIDLVINEDSSFYFSNKLDISDAIITEVDAMYERESKIKK